MAPKHGWERTHQELKQVYDCFKEHLPINYKNSSDGKVLTTSFIVRFLTENLISNNKLATDG